MTSVLVVTVGEAAVVVVVFVVFVVTVPDVSTPEAPTSVVVVAVVDGEPVGVPYTIKAMPPRITMAPIISPAIRVLFILKCE